MPWPVSQTSTVTCRSSVEVLMVRVPEPAIASTALSITLVQTWLSSPGLALIFFFQAEDGIRDVAVTGVQTCALPIYDELAQRLDVVERRAAADHLVEHDAERP